MCRLPIVDYTNENQVLSGPSRIILTKIRSFGLEPPLDDLFPEATWSSQQLGCGREEFALGVAGLFWHPAAAFPQGSSLSRPSWEWCISLMRQGWGLGTPGKVVLETNSACQRFNGLRLIRGEPRGVCAARGCRSSSSSSRMPPAALLPAATWGAAKSLHPLCMCK